MCLSVFISPLFVLTPSSCWAVFAQIVKNVLKLENCSGEIPSPGCSEVLKLGPGPDEFVSMTLELIPKNNRHISELNSLVCVTEFTLSVTMTSKWKIRSLLSQQEHTQRPTKRWSDSLVCPLAVLCCWSLRDKLNRRLFSAWTQPGHPKPHEGAHLQRLYKYTDYCLHVNKYNYYYHFIYKYVIWYNYKKLTVDASTLHSQGSYEVFMKLLNWQWTTH